MSSLERRVDFEIVDLHDDTLPALSKPPSQPEWPVRAPVVSTAIFAAGALGSAFFIPFSGVLAVPVFLCSVVIISACWFFVSLALALVWRQWKHGSLVHAWERAAAAELGDPYDRWRVYARELERTVEISIVRYVPQHAADCSPLYRAELVEAREFDPEQEIEALELLSEWQERADERERASADSYESGRGLSQSAGALAERLQSQLPASAAGGRDAG